MKTQLGRKTEHVVDPVQFAYRTHRGAQDATITLFNLLSKHLEGKIAVY